MSFAGLWESLLPVGRDPAGGYNRFSWTPADAGCRAWSQNHSRQAASASVNE